LNRRRYEGYVALREAIARQALASFVAAATELADTVGPPDGGIAPIRGARPLTST
jgi:hypothetical protein